MFCNPTRIPSPSQVRTNRSDAMELVVKERKRKRTCMHREVVETARSNTGTKSSAPNPHWHTILFATQPRMYNRANNVQEGEFGCFYQTNNADCCCFLLPIVYESPRNLSKAAHWLTDILPYHSCKEEARRFFPRVRHFEHNWKQKCLSGVFLN